MHVRASECAWGLGYWRQWRQIGDGIVCIGRVNVGILDIVTGMEIEETVVTFVIIVQ